MPVGQNKWEAVAVEYNAAAREAGRNDKTAQWLKQFYMYCLKEGNTKPTGNPHNPWKVKGAQEIYRDIPNVMVMGSLQDEDPVEEELEEAEEGAEVNEREEDAGVISPGAKAEDEPGAEAGANISTELSEVKASHKAGAEHSDSEEDKEEDEDNNCESEESEDEAEAAKETPGKGKQSLMETPI
jgi:hypothetical protein